MRSAEEMRAAFARFEESGLSLKAFGDREEIPYTTLQYWRWRFRDQAGRNDGAAARRADAVDLASVRVVEDRPSTSPPASGFEVWLANGVCLEVLPGFDANELRRLVDVLATC